MRQTAAAVVPYRAVLVKSIIFIFFKFGGLSCLPPPPPPPLPLPAAAAAAAAAVIHQGAAAAVA